MEKYTVERQIEWGECDAAGIVFYPNYYKWMDAAFHTMTRQIGFDHRTLTAGYGLVGTPLIHTECAFRAPARFYDDLRIDVTIRELKTSSLTLDYTFRVGGRIVAEGAESRVFVKDGPDGFSKAEIPAPLRQRLEAFQADA